MDGKPSKKQTAKPEKRQPGRKPERVKLAGDFGDAIERALKKPKPSGGWPDRPMKRGGRDG